ncbi:MAG: hypothetical protein JST87_14280 [Bacteroidetes bacterium]|nr:hypothetical protein [Bacteroidota bacterium]MBS1933963.1 hypothetical protein [Bacteroidota bacterium]
MEGFSSLSKEDKLQLLKYPAYISLLASTSESGIDRREIEVASKLTHVRTFAGDPLLAGFYREADKIFHAMIESLNTELPKEKMQRARAIERALDNIESILKKLSPLYETALRYSMRMYKDQVSKAHHNVLEYFIFPMPIKGLSD